MELTGMSAPAFEHMTRVGILRPAQGTAGNRAHRRFEGPTLTLISILAHYWRQGVGPTDLLDIAERFYAATDWFRDNGLIGHEPVAEILIRLGSQASGPARISANSLRGFQSHSGDRPLTAIGKVRASLDKLGWNELVNVLRESAFEISDRLASTCRELSPSAWEEHALRYFTVSDQACSLSFVRTLYLFQTRAGYWRDEYEVAPANAEFFSTVNVIALKKRLFGMKPLRPA
jgi:hypothetical protein